PSCSCPDHETRRLKCKHIYAVEFTVKREIRPDGSSKVTKSVRISYTQDWPAYNAAQVHEKERVAELLFALCEGIVQPPQGRGRPRLPLSDMVFASVMKVYSTMSGRRASTDLRHFTSKGYLASAPHYNSVFHYLESPMLHPILRSLVEETASPLKAIETDFAVDSSGFSTSIFQRWFDAKYGKMRVEHEWIKAHLMVGVKTNIVTGVEISEGTANDAPHLPKLLEATASRFDISEVSADKGYISKKNLEAIVRAGGTPYIPFKTNATGEGPELWRKLYHYYQFNRPAFLSHYHKRSNVESTFSMIKRKFGGAVRSKDVTAQINEVLCKVVAHNLCVLVQSIFELGIEPIFWANSAAAQQVKPGRKLLGKAGEHAFGIGHAVHRRSCGARLRARSASRSAAGHAGENRCGCAGPHRKTGHCKTERLRAAISNSPHGQGFQTGFDSRGRVRALDARYGSGSSS
ncbi:MAG: transposase, partial [Bryobacteraceae bacterium]